MASILTLYFLGIMIYNLFKDEPEDEELDEREAFWDIALPVLAAIVVNVINLIFIR